MKQKKGSGAKNESCPTQRKEKNENQSKSPKQIKGMNSMG